MRTNRDSRKGGDAQSCQACGGPEEQEGSINAHRASESNWSLNQNVTLATAPILSDVALTQNR